VGTAFNNLTEPPPPVDDGTLKKITNAADKDLTGQSRGGLATEDLEKSDKTRPLIQPRSLTSSEKILAKRRLVGDLERERAETVTKFTSTNA
jgi:hypothetical protein